MAFRLGAALLVAGLFTSQASAASFTYDAIGRLLTYTADNGVTVRYCYDLSGNRTQVTASASCPTVVARSAAVAVRTAGAQPAAPTLPSLPPTPPATPTSSPLPNGLPDVLYTARDAARPNE